MERSPVVLLASTCVGAALWGCGSPSSATHAKSRNGSSGGIGGASSSSSSASSSSSGGQGGAGGGVTGTVGSCGDGVCGAGETCLSCSSDCGLCCNGATCCGNGVIDPGETCSTCPQDAQDAQGEPCPRVGMFYLGWHQPAYTAVQAKLALGKPAITVEDLLRSRVDTGAPPGPVYTFADLLQQDNLEGVAGSFYYQATTATGPYCIVHRRSPGALNYEPTHEGNDGSGPVADCPMYAETLARQALQLTVAGVDFVVLDQTNIADYGAAGDAIQLRPFEVVLEEWGKLRQAGFRTPDVAGWQRLSAPGTMVPHVLAVYEVPENQSILLHDAKTGKKLLFYPDLPDVDPTLVASVASNGGKNDILPVPMWVDRQAHGSWSFFSVCQQGTMLDDAPCAQTATASSVVGSQLAVSPSYQLGYASLPFQGVGVYRGLTLRKQFEAAFAIRPRWLFLSSWNEHVAQPQSSAPGVSMGLESDTTFTDKAFVDTYGVEFSRDIEPSKEYGSLIYDIVTSCLRVYRKGGATCDQPAEPCCQGGNFSARYATFYGPGGPFVLYAPALGAGNGRRALYACRAGVADDFFSPDPACEGTTVLKHVGFVSTVKGGETLRALRRCYGAASHAYALGSRCPTGMMEEAVLGYVR